MACSKPTFFPDSKEESHQHNMNRLCIMCFGKSKGHMLSEKHKNIFAIYVYTHADYWEDAWLLPSGLCEGCRRKLESLVKEEKRPLGKLHDYFAIVQYVKSILSVRVLRSQGDQPLQCPCELCERSTTSGRHGKLKEWKFETEKASVGRPLDSSKPPPIDPTKPPPTELTVNPHFQLQLKKHGQVIIPHFEPPEKLNKWKTVTRAWDSLTIKVDHTKLNLKQYFNYGLITEIEAVVEAFESSVVNIDVELPYISY